MSTNLNSEPKFFLLKLKDPKDSDIYPKWVKVPYEIKCMYINCPQILLKFGKSDGSYTLIEYVVDNSDNP